MTVRDWITIKLYGNESSYNDYKSKKILEELNQYYSKQDRPINNIDFSETITYRVSNVLTKKLSI